MSRCGGIEVRNLGSRDYGFRVEAMVAELLADIPAADLCGLYQVALLDAQAGRNERTRWLGVYSNRDGRHALIELYLEPILGKAVSPLDRASGFLLSRIRLAQALYHQVGVHRQRMVGRESFFGPQMYSRYLLLRLFNPAKLLLYFPRRVLRSWRNEQRSAGETRPEARTRLGGGR
ncbi:MAG: hypothetical protein ACM3RP_07265 [Chitinophagales bacterium]